MMPQRVVAGAQQVEDLVVIAEALLGGQVVEPLPNRLTANNRGERLWIGLIISLMTLMSSWCSTAQCRARLPSASLMRRTLGVAKGLICCRAPLMRKAMSSFLCCCSAFIVLRERRV